jgi:deoxyadenosine/deoxycytidine kinase
VTQDPESIGRISVVGPCASGKSTIVRALRMHGYDAHVTSQEHSAVPDLWNRQEPAVLIALQADLESVRLRRRNPRWSRAVWQAQQDRLADAFAHADYVADTTNLNANQVVADVLDYLGSRTRVDGSE